MFTEPETLRVSEGNGWRPEKGAEKVDALKGSSLKREGLPSLLQLHLKRFKYDWETGETSKINDCVTFPLELSLSEIISDDGDDGNDDTIYDLQSIVIHRGEYGSGHYYSYVRPDIRTDDWYRFDDSQVTRVEYSEVIADAYGGRYKRKRSRSVDGNNARKKQRGLFSRIFSLGRSSSDGGGFGYGGRTSSAYMLQYARRSDIPTLYLENNN
jgi:ubiquitin carboxyl-terminal hydrolase 7